MFVVERFSLPLSLSFCCESPLHSALIVDRKYRPVNAFKFFCAGDVPKKRWIRARFPALLFTGAIVASAGDWQGQFRSGTAAEELNLTDKRKSHENTVITI